MRLIRASGKGRGTLALVPVALALLLTSCGGDSSKESDNAGVARAPSGATSTTPETGASGGGSRADAGGKRSRRKHRESTGTGGAAPAPDTVNKVKKRLKRQKRQLQKEIQKVKGKTQKQGSKGGSSTPTTTTPPPPRPSVGPQQVLFKKAKRVCEDLTLNGLARKYNVEATPEAVATAYAASYPETFRQSVHDGCLAAYS